MEGGVSGQSGSAISPVYPVQRYVSFRSCAIKVYCLAVVS